jgi:hypothetical protein
MKTTNNATQLNHNPNTCKSALFFLGLCLAILAAAASPAYARSTTGFSAFRLQGTTKAELADNPYSCLTELFGAVINNCKKPVSLEFDLPIDHIGTKNVQVQDYYAGTDAENTFTCQVSAYAGTSASDTPGSFINFTAPLQNLTATVDVTADGMSIQLICSDVPPGGGISNLNWNQ